MFADEMKRDHVVKRRLVVEDVVFVPLAEGRLDRATVTIEMGEWEARAESEHCLYSLLYDETPAMPGCPDLDGGRWHCFYGEHKGSGIPVVAKR